MKVIYLDGPDGNAYVLMSYARQYATQLGLDSDQIIKEMKESDYENLLKVFNHYFGDFVELVR